MSEQTTTDTTPAHRAKTITKGRIVTHDGLLYRVELMVDFETLVATEVETGRAQALPMAKVKLACDDKAQGQTSRRPIDALDDEDWKTAWERLEAIRPLLKMQRYGRADVDRRASEVGRTGSTLYTWLGRYRDAQDITALVPNQRGWRKGASRITGEAEAVIAQAIKDVYLNKHRRKAIKVVQQVRNLCANRGIEPPSEPTIRARIAKIPEEERLRKRGFSEAADNRFNPVAGQFPGADYPLAVLQIDHTMADLVVVDDILRLPIGRPWITVAIDVYSRMVAGVHISFDPPCTTSVARCVAQAVLPKDELLLQLEVEAEWPVWGWPTTVHMDNAGEFRGRTLREACAHHGVHIEYRPVKRPHYGAHIERLLGTLMAEIHDLPGTTFSSVEEKGKHDPDKHAALTLSEFERWVVSLICGVYHRREHRTTGKSPLKQWDIGVFGSATTPGAGMQARPENGADILRDFLPKFERTVQRTGAGIKGWFYYAAVLKRWIGARDPHDPRRPRKFTFRRDPRDVSRVWFFDPELEQYFELPTADQTIPPMSEWERREVRKHMDAQNIDKDAPGAVAKAMEALREQAEAAQTRTRKARRKVQRRRTDEAQRQATRTDSEPADEARARSAPGMTYEPVTPYGAIE